MRNISDKICGENQNTLFMFKIPFFLKKNRTNYEIKWQNGVESERPFVTT